MDIAVLMPVRNGATTIGAALATVQAQIGVAFEIVVVDDGSTDATPAVLARAAASDTRLTILTRPPLGIVAALNHGLEHLSDRVALIARMDADDEMVEGRLAEQTDYLNKHQEISVAATQVSLSPAESPMATYVAWLNSIETSEDVDREMFVESPLCHPSVAFRATAVAGVGGYRDETWPEDYDLWLRLHLAGHAMAVVPKPLHVWHDHPNRLTRTDPRYSRSSFVALKAHHLVRKLGCDLRIWGAGRDGKRLARALEAEGARLHQFVDIDPKKIGGLRRGQVPVVGPDDVGPPDPTRPLISAVGIPAARRGIRLQLTSRGYIEGRDFICAA